MHVLSLTQTTEGHKKRHCGEHRFQTFTVLSHIIMPQELRQHTQYSEYATRWMTQQRQDTFSSPKHPHLLWAHRVSIKWLTGSPSQGVKWSGFEDDHTPPSSAKDIHTPPSDSWHVQV